MNVCERNLCPKCGNVPSRLSGYALWPRNDMAAAHGHLFLVCWPCDWIVRIGGRMEWRKMRDMRARIRAHQESRAV